MTDPDGSPTSKKFMQYARALLPLVLLASWPFVAFLANNRDQTLRASDVIIPWFTVVAGAVAGTLIFALLLHNRPINRISIVVGVLCAAFFSFGSVRQSIFN